MILKKMADNYNEDANYVEETCNGFQCGIRTAFSFSQRSGCKYTGGNEKLRMMVRQVPEALQSVLPMLTDRQKICVY